jgi:hypothetical protein
MWGVVAENAATLELKSQRLSAWNTVAIEKLVVPQLVKKFPEFYKIRQFITVLTIL